MDPKITLDLFIIVMSGLTIAVGVIVSAISQSRVIVAACDNMARQPELAGELRFTMIIGLAMIESLAIYCLLISLILLFLRWV